MIDVTQTVERHIKELENWCTCEPDQPECNPCKTADALAAQARELAALRRVVPRLVELLRQSRRYVAAHDYNARGMQLGPPPIGAVLRDLLVSIDAALAAAEEVT